MDRVRTLNRHIATGSELDFFSTVPASRSAYRFAIAMVVISTLVFVATIPVARTPVPREAAFIPVYESALAINALITALLLFGQFHRLRSWALLVLASGYL